LECRLASQIMPFYVVASVACVNIDENPFPSSLMSCTGSAAAKDFLLFIQILNKV
jgi:hypothetical protein